MIQKYDLHIHSNKSDGKFSIEDIICLLRIKGIDTFSITDHDSITSISITKRCDLQDLTYISGVEMSSITSKYKAHILGYDIDGNLIQLKELCEKVRKLRIQRIYERLSYLKENYGIDLDKCRIENLLRQKNEKGEPILEKYDLSQILLELGFCSNIQEAYKKYLDYEAYLTTYRMNAEQVIAAIHSAGGKAILAHPIQMERKYNKDISDMIGDFIDIGIDGIEVFNSKHMHTDCIRYYNLARSMGLLTTGGSDFHQEPNTFLGRITGDAFNTEISKKYITILDERNKKKINDENNSKEER